MPPEDALLDETFLIHAGGESHERWRQLPTGMALPARVAAGPLVACSANSPHLVVIGTTPRSNKQQVPIETYRMPPLVMTKLSTGREI